MRKTLLFALLLMTFWMACEISDDEFKKKIHIMPLQAEIEAAKTTYERLNINFDHRIDNRRESYEHKIIKARIENMQKLFPDTKMPAATLSIYIYIGKDKFSDLSDSGMICTINYVAKRPLYPNKIMVKMNEKITTNHVNPDYIIHNFVCLETMVYHSESELLSFIVENPDKEVRVRLVNKARYYFDFIIDKDIRQAIRETVELYNAWLILQKAEVPPEPPDLF